MTAFAATARGELYMQLRKPAIWIATALPFALYALFAVLGSDSTGLQRYRYETSPKVKYLGVCAATAVPVALLYVAVALGFTVWRGQPAAPWWGLATFMVIVLPLLLLVGSLSFLGPQLMPLPLFRVLIVALFFWAVVTEVESEFPSFAGTVFSLTMDYPPLGVFFDSRNATTGHASVALDFLRPRPTTATAALAVALMLALAAAILCAARALNARTSE